MALLQGTFLQYMRAFSQFKLTVDGKEGFSIRDSGLSRRRLGEPES
jgi:hypothetical protein